MRCPLSGKPCLMPKDVFVTEIHENETRHLFLCKICAEKYTDLLEHADTVTKSMEVISSENGIRYAEHIVDDNQIHPDDADALEFDLEEEIERAIVEQEIREEYHEPALDPQIKKVEAKMQEAIDSEDYEAATQLRDVLTELRQKKAEQDESN